MNGRGDLTAHPLAILWCTAAICATAGEATASEGGLELVPDPMLLIGLLVLFGVLIAPVNTFLFKPIFRVLENRDEKINGTLSRATHLSDEVRKTLAQYEASIREVREGAEAERKHHLSQARDDGSEHTTRARAVAEAEIERARRDIEEALERARETLRSEAQELAGQAAARVLGRALP